MDADYSNSVLLFTGGTGFFGRSLLRRWIEQERCGNSVPRVVVLSRDPRGFLDSHREYQGFPWLEFHTGDVLEPSSLPNDRTFTHVLHAAADSALGPRLPPLTAYRQIADGTRNVLDTAVKTSARRFLFVSSGAVYGAQPPELEGLSETWPGSPALEDPRSAYGLAKRAGEHLCTLYRHQFGLETVVARCFAFVGPDLDLNVHFAIGNFIRDALWRDQIVISGDGKSVRSYLHQQDLAVWLSALLMRGKAGQVYNVGSDEAVSTFALATMVCDSLSPGKRIHTLERSDVVAERSRYVPDVSRIEKELGVSVSIPLREAISLTAAEIRARQRS